MNLRFVRLLIAGLAACSAAQASAVFTADSLSGSPGQTLTFGGTLTNDWGYDAYLIGVSITITGFSDPASIDPAPFFLNAPLQLADGAVSGPYDWFQVLIPAGFAGGTYQGGFVLLGGPGEDSQNVLDTAGFEVRVQNDSEVPEPATGLVTAGGLLLCAAWWRVRKRGHGADAVSSCGAASD